MEEHRVRMNRALPASVTVVYMQVKHMNKDNNMNQLPAHF